MDEDIAEYAMKMASTLKVKYADVRLESQEKNEIILRNGILGVVSHAINEGIGIRIITENGVGFSSSNVLDKKSAEKTVKEAFRQAEACQRKNPPELSDEKAAEATWSVPERKKLADTGIEEKLDVLFQI